MKTPTTALVLLLACLAAPCLAQAPPMQPEFEVSQGTLYYQYAYGVAIDKQGRFVVSWNSYNETDQNYDTLGRLYDGSGAPEGDEFVVDPLAGDQYGGDVAKDASGRFVVVWHEYNSVHGRRFEADGTPLGASFPISTSAVPVADEHVASDASGNFVVVWTRTDVSSTDNVVARRFDGNGAPLGGEFVVNAYTTDVQRARGVATSASGFAVAWAGEGTGGPGVWARRFDAAGAPLTGDLPVNQGPLLFAIAEADVAMSADGQFVLAWDGAVPPSNLGVFARRYDAAGAPLGGQFAVNTTYTSGYQGSSRVASDNAGNFIVSWTGESSDGDGTAVLARTFDRFGAPVSEDFVVNSTTTGYQYTSSVALNDGGTFVVAWQSPDASYYGVVGRRGGAKAAPQISISTLTLAADNAVLEPGESVQVETAWVNETDSDLAVTGTATDFSGPPGATYTLTHDSASYGTIPSAATGTCLDGGDCYAVSVDAPVTRPAQHWDTLLQEAASIGVPHTWILHVGESFADVPTDNQFYAFIETLFHNGVTGGCASGYCPDQPRHARPDGGLPPEIQVRPGPRPAAVHRDRLHRRAVYGRALRPMDRGARGPRGDGRVRRRPLLSRQRGDAPADGRLPAESPAGLDVRSSHLHGNLRRRPLPQPVRRLDRGPLRAVDHRGMLRLAGALLPDQPQQPGADGGVSREDLRPRSVRRLTARRPRWTHWIRAEP